MKAAAEFFAGIGLVRMALERCGWRVAFANDIDPKKFQIYQDNFGAHEFVLGDVRRISPNSIPPIQLATASFPCIDVSLAGNRAGLRGKHSSAYWLFHTILDALRTRRPEFVLIENVLGLISSNKGRDLAEIIASLNGLDYSCDLLAVDARHFVPQSRPRLFIVAERDAEPSEPHFALQHSARPTAVWEFMCGHPNLQWIIHNLPPLPQVTRSLANIVESIPDTDPRWWDSRRRRHLYGQMSEAHRLVLRQMVRSRSPKYATVYKRVRPAGCRAELRSDGLAGCLRTPRGGSSKQFLVEACQGAWNVRNLTSREYARLQGVPETFAIKVPENQALFGFGDAVCVPAVEWIVKNCIDTYLAVPQERGLERSDTQTYSAVIAAGGTGAAD